MIYYVVPLMCHGRAHAKIHHNVLLSNIFTTNLLYQTEVQVFTIRIRKGQGQGMKWKVL